MWSPLPSSQPLRWELALGYSLLSSHMRGVVPSPLVAVQKDDLSSGPSALTEISWRLSKHFALSAHAACTLYYPRTDLYLVTDRIGSLSPLHVAAGLSALLVFSSAERP
ncbi:MAG: hypothetical protein QM756_13870 [Polyangiaceae bacterium]